MDNFVFDEKGNDELLDDDSPEDAFMQGYAEDERKAECEECGSSIEDENKVMKDIEGEKHVFCSKLCAKEYEESL